MSSMFGSHLKLSLYGQSHGEAIGVVMDGFPAGMAIDMESIHRESRRRRPGQSDVSTARQESDEPAFLSGVFHGRTTGQPICIQIRNEGMHSKDYGETMDLVRPSHADYSGHVRYDGFEDFRGGGSFSGRLTAPLVVAGELCRQWLVKEGIRIETHIRKLGGVEDDPMEGLPEDADLSFLREETLPTLQKSAGEAMHSVILKAASEQDSVGGEVEGRIVGLPAGMGSPFFDSVESVLSHLFFSIPAVKGVSFGAGFAFADMFGHEANDPFCFDHGRIVTTSNHAGGINGGITNGMPVLYRCAIRPTPSIGREQATVSLVTGKNGTLTIHGRHDPCIIPRVIPVMDAVAALGIMELWKERKACVR